MDADVDFGALRDRPFELLRAMERHGLRLAAGSLGHEEAEWSGLGFRMGDERFVCPRDDVREVLVYPDAMTRVPGTREWLGGLANVRGNEVAVVIQQQRPLHVRDGEILNHRIGVLAVADERCG